MFVFRMIFSENRFPLFRIMLMFVLRMISAQTLRICREGKPVPASPYHARVVLPFTLNV
jgi:hypothetical protein